MIHDLPSAEWWFASPGVRAGDCKKGGGGAPRWFERDLPALPPHPLITCHDPDKVVQGLYGRTSTPRTRTALKFVRVRVVRFGRTRTALQTVRVTLTCTGTDGAGP